MIKDKKQHCEVIITEAKMYKSSERYEKKKKKKKKKKKIRKSSGSERATIKFYKLFWNNIKHYFLNSVNYSYENGYLTE